MVLIASAIASMRKRWAERLRGSFHTLEVGDRATLEQTMTKRKPSVLLLDLGLPQLGGLDGVSAVQKLSPSTRIILLTSTSDDREAILALKSGVKGYCGTDIESVFLKKAVEVVQKGEIWVGRKLIPNLLEELHTLTEKRDKDSPLRPSVNLDCLTPREHQVAKWIGNGFCNKDIAKQLNISERTVKAHLNAIFRKLKVSDRLQLALLVADYHRVNR